MAIFNSYVKLPEGNSIWECLRTQDHHGSPRSMALHRPAASAARLREAPRASFFGEELDQLQKDDESHRKTIGKWWFYGKIIGKP